MPKSIIFFLLWTISVSLSRYLPDYQKEDELLENPFEKNVYFDAKNNAFHTKPDRQIEEFLEDSVPDGLSTKFEEIPDGDIPENELHLDDAIPISTASTMFSHDTPNENIVKPAEKIDNSTKPVDALYDPGIEEPMVLKIHKPLCDN